MSHHLSGAFSIEVELDRLTEAIAQRTAIVVVGQLRATPAILDPETYTRPAGSDAYERPADPGPGAGPGRGRTRFGGVLENGTVEPEPDQP